MEVERPKKMKIGESEEINFGNPREIYAHNVKIHINLVHNESQVSDKTTTLRDLQDNPSKLELFHKYKIKTFHSVPLYTDYTGTLEYDKPISLIHAAAESSDVMKLIAQNLGFAMQIDPMTFMEFISIISHKMIHITDRIRKHINDCTKMLDMDSIVGFINKEISPNLLSGEALYVYLFGDEQYIIPDIVKYNLEDIPTISSWRPFGMLLLADNIRRRPGQEKFKIFISPIRRCIAYLLEPIGDARPEVEHAHTHFLLGMSNFSDMVNQMKIMGIVPPMCTMYSDYLIRCIHRYNNVLNRKYGSTIDIIHWNKDPEVRRHFFENTVVYSMYNDLELMTTFGIPLSSRDRLRSDYYPQLPEDFDVVKWRLSYFGCNDMSCRIVDGTGREIIEELDVKEDIIISYGTFLNHRCWTAGVLLGVFDSSTMQLYNPSYLYRDEERKEVNYTYDSISEMKYFSEDQIIELYVMLSAIPALRRPENVNSLLDKLRKYMESSVGNYTKMLQLEFRQIDPEFQPFFVWFLNWCLLMSLYARRWKGLGYEYPYTYLGQEKRYGYEKGKNICSLIASNANLAGQFRRYNVLKDMENAELDDIGLWERFDIFFGRLAEESGISTEPNQDTVDQLRLVVSLIRNLNIIEIDERNLIPVISNGTDSKLTNLLEKLAGDEACSPHFSDISRTTAVFYLVNIVGVKFDEINDNMNRFLNWYLSEYSTPELSALPIDIGKFYDTGHIDPTLDFDENIDTKIESQTDKYIKYLVEYITFFSSHSYFWSNVTIKEEELMKF